MIEHTFGNMHGMRPLRFELKTTFADGTIIEVSADPINVTLSCPPNFLEPQHLQIDVDAPQFRVSSYDEQLELAPSEHSIEELLEMG